jgi:hypothetical protein
MKKFTLIIIGIAIIMFVVVNCHDSTTITQSSVVDKDSQLELQPKNSPLIIDDDQTSVMPANSAPDDINKNPQNKIFYNNDKMVSYTNIPIFTPSNDILTPTKLQLLQQKQSKQDIKNKQLLQQKQSKQDIKNKQLLQQKQSKQLNNIQLLQQKQSKQLNNKQLLQQKQSKQLNNIQKQTILDENNEINETDMLPSIEFPFNAKPVNDYMIPEQSFENKYWNINNNKFSLLASSQINNIKYFNGINDNIKQSIQTPISEMHPGNDEYPPKTLRYNNNDYTIFGLASNSYYNIYFVVYEKLVYFDEPEIPNYGNYKLYEYLLVKLINNKLKIMQLMQPRNKINMGEYVSFTFGVSQLNFLLVTPI